MGEKKSIHFLRINYLKLINVLKNNIIFVITFFAISVIASNALSAAYYVDNTATGLNNGASWANAWQSFSAISGLSSGDVVYISGGSLTKTYNETLTAVAGVKYQVGQSSPHNGQVIIDAQATRNYCIVSANNMTISGTGSITTYGIKCQNSVDDGIHSTSGTNNVKVEYVEVYSGGRVVNGDCVQVGDSSGWEISHAYIHQCFQDGVNSSGGAATDWGQNSIHDSIILHTCDDGLQAGTGWDIYNNEIGFMNMDLNINPHCVGANGHPDGLQLQRLYYRVYNNLIHDSATYNMWVSSTQGAGGIDGHIRFLNNIIYMTDHTNYGTSVRGISYAASSTTEVTDVIIANNTIVDNGGSNAGGAIELWVSSTLSNLHNFYVYNNIVYNSSGFSLGYVIQDNYVSNKGAIIDYNIVATDGSHGNTTIQYNGSNISYSDWVNTYHQNTHGSNNRPTFTNYSFLGGKQAIDLRLSDSDTAAINKGTSVTIPNFPSGWPFDYWGTVRPQGSQWDIGAYEHNYNRPQPPTKVIVY